MTVSDKQPSHGVIQMTEFKIESGIEPPQWAHGKSKFPWHRLHVGDSFDFGDEDVRIVRGSAACYTRKTGWQFRISTAEHRVWRVS